MDYALYLWTFLLIGNAAAIVLLSTMTSGGTSTMGQGGPRVFPPKF